MTNRKSTTSFLTSYRWSAYVTPKFPKGVSKSDLFVYCFIKFNFNRIKSATDTWCLEADDYDRECKGLMYVIYMVCMWGRMITNPDLSRPFQHVVSFSWLMRLHIDSGSLFQRSVNWVRSLMAELTSGVSCPEWRGSGLRRTDDDRRLSGNKLHSTQSSTDNIRIARADFTDCTGSSATKQKHSTGSSRPTGHRVTPQRPWDLGEI